MNHELALPHNLSIYKKKIRNMILGEVPFTKLENKPESLDSMSTHQ